MTDWPYRIEEHFGNDCMELILATNYTIDGVPMVYCGNELADKARLSMFANRFHPGKFEFTDRNVAGEAVERRMSIVSKLNMLKNTSDALINGETVWLDASKGSVLAFDRVSESEKITFAGNFSKDAVELDIEAGEVILSNNAMYEDGKLKLSGYGYTIMKRG